jgi:hydrogenase nickel incorporation protein HypB
MMMSKIIVTEDECEKLDIELEESITERNRILANENRRILDSYKVRAIDVMGATGSGKTTLILQICRRIKDRYRIAVIKGDLTSSIDSDMIMREGVDSVQVNTGKECHLDASQIRRALEKLDLSNLEVIFIENVGNLICPAEFPLGSHKRIVVISVTEGPYTVVKHPFMFMDADIVVINKMDLTEAMKIDPDKLVQDIRKVNPRAHIVKAICRDGVGIDEVIRALDL